MRSRGETSAVESWRVRAVGSSFAALYIRTDQSHGDKDHRARKFDDISTRNFASAINFLGTMPFRLLIGRDFFVAARPSPSPAFSDVEAWF